MMHHWHGGWGVGNWLLMGFGTLLFWALVVAALVWLIHATTARPTAGALAMRLDKPVGPNRPSAQDILDERYARGEIGDEEYRTRRDNLNDQ